MGMSWTCEMASKAASYVLRSLGRSFDGIGKALQGELAYTETMGAHRAGSAFKGATPAVAADAFVAPSATVVGDVSVGEGSSVWYDTVLRGDVNKIAVGSNTHIGDRTVVHVASETGSLNNSALSTIIGRGGSIGPLSVIHACTVGDGAVIGGCSKVLDGAKIEAGAVIEAGSLVGPGKTVPAGQVWAGCPAKYVRDVTPTESAEYASQLAETAALSRAHSAECSKPWTQVHQEQLEATEAQFRDPDYNAEFSGVFAEEVHKNEVGRWKA